MANFWIVWNASQKKSDSPEHVAHGKVGVDVECLMHRT
jgi:hypothetical protein